MIAVAGAASLEAMSRLVRFTEMRNLSSITQPAFAACAQDRKECGA
jgi:hypothetical protein